MTNADTRAAEAMKWWRDLEERVNAMDDAEKNYYIGFAEALLYAQASYWPQTLKTHLPAPEYPFAEGIKFDKSKLTDIIEWLDSEGGIVSHIITTEGDEYKTDYIELGSSEGHFGPPEWD